MISIRHRNERGHANHGWLDTYHTFSFDTYYDPNYMGFRSLRVNNEDRVAPGRGLGKTDQHADIVRSAQDLREAEVRTRLTVVVVGIDEVDPEALQPLQALPRGRVRRLRRADLCIVQRNGGEEDARAVEVEIPAPDLDFAKAEPVHLLQIWIMPEVLHIQPSYEQKKIDHDNMRGKWLLIASRNPSESAVQIQQDAKLCAAVLDDHQVLEYEIKTGRHAWLQIARGNVQANGVSLQAGDGAAYSAEPAVQLAGKGEVLLFDLA